MSNPWYDIFLATLAAAAMIFIPLIVWLCLFCAERKLKEAEVERDEIALAELAKGKQDEITAFQTQHPETVEANLPPSYELEEINHKWRSRVRELKRSSEKRSGGRDSVSCWRIFSITMYISSWICLLFIVIYVPLAMPNNLLYALLIVAAVGLGGGVLFVCIESIFSRERRHLKNLDSSVAIDELLRKLRTTAPSILFHAVAYHYETRTRHVHYTDSRGKRRSRTETYQQKVVTGTFREVFKYKQWKDESDTTIEDISMNRVTRIKMDLGIEFVDVNTQTAFIRQYELFKQRYKHRDTHVDFSETRTVTGYESRLAAYTDLNEKPWWIRQRYYCIASLLYMTWPYRIMFNRATARTSYTLYKTVQSEAVSPENVFVTSMPANETYQPEETLDCKLPISNNTLSESKIDIS